VEETGIDSRCLHVMLKKLPVHFSEFLDESFELEMSLG
jgi:hypothetical protein